MNYKGWFKDCIILFLLGKVSNALAFIFCIYMMYRAFKHNSDEFIGTVFVVGMFFALAFIFDVYLYLTHPFITSLVVTIAIAVLLATLGNKLNK